MMKRKYILTFFIISLCVRNGMQAMNTQQYSLHQAIDLENVERVKRLIEGKADVNQRDNHNVTPLCLSIN